MTSWEIDSDHSNRRGIIRSDSASPTDTNKCSNYEWIIVKEEIDSKEIPTFNSKILKENDKLSSNDVNKFDINTDEDLVAIKEEAIDIKEDRTTYATCNSNSPTNVAATICGVYGCTPKQKTDLQDTQEKLFCCDVCEYETSLCTEKPHKNVCNCIVESLLNNAFSLRSHAQQNTTVKNNKPMPILNISSKSKAYVRHFKNNVYKDIPWICGCAHLSKFFCWPCLLFSEEVNVWNKNGFNDLNNLTKARKRHEYSQQHISSYIKLKQFERRNQMELQSKELKANIERHNKTVAANRYMLSKLIDVVCFLSDQDYLHTGQNSKESYVNLLYLLSNSDSQLKLYLEQSDVFANLLSHTQNNVISAISNVLLEEVKREIHAAKYVSIMVDESTGINCKSQLSTVFRYVSKSGNIEERFVGFTDLNGNSLSTLIIKFADDYGCKQKLVAQTYDAAVATAGKQNIVQAKVKEICSNAIFVHCCNYRLDAIFAQSVSFIKDCKTFFQSLAAFGTFFTKSTKIMMALDQEIKTCFPPHSPIKWNCSTNILSAVMQHKVELRALFLTIIDNSEQWDSDTATTARGLYSYLTDFSFNFLLQTFAQIFPSADVLSDILQTKYFDISYCIQKIEDFINYLQSKRNDFDSLWLNLQKENEWTDLCPIKRMKLDETDNRRISCKRLFLEVIDTVVTNTKERFSDIKNLMFISLLDGTRFKEYAKKFPESSFNSLKRSYGTLFDFSKLRSELIYVYSSPDFTVDSLITIRDLIVTNNVKDILGELYNLISLILTIPSAKAECAEQSTTMKRIKKYVHSAPSEDKFSALAIMSVEKQLLLSLKETDTFYDRIIDEFSKKELHIDLQYKK